MWNGNGIASFLKSREGVTQGGALAMVAYSIGILPLIKNLKVEYPDFTQPWYADGAGALGTFARVESYFNSLNLHSPGRGFTPNPLKVLFLCIQKILVPENSLSHVVYLSCSWERIILVVISGMKNQNVIG